MPEQLIIIQGKPIGKARPRFSRAGAYVKVYSAQAKIEKQIAKEIRLQWKNKPLECPVIAEFTFCMPITKASKKIVADMLNGLTRHIKKPDCSNMVKMYEDCANGIVWKDDSHIWGIDAQKIYSLEPKTIIKVKWEEPW